MFNFFFLFNSGSLNISLMQCLSKIFCGCCNTEIDESGNELTNNDSIKKKENSAIKIQRAFRKWNKPRQKNNINQKSLLEIQKKVDYVSGFPNSTTNKQINKGINNNKDNEKQKNNNNINNDDYKIFGKKKFINYYNFLQNNNFDENDDYNKKNNKSKTNIYNSLDQSNNSNNNNFGAPEAENKTKENKNINSHNNLCKIFEEYDSEKKNISKQVEFDIIDDIKNDADIQNIV